MGLWIGRTTLENGLSVSTKAEHMNVLRFSNSPFLVYTQHICVYIHSYRFQLELNMDESYNVEQKKLEQEIIYSNCISVSSITSKTNLCC